MTALLLLFCCVFACPLLMGGAMWFMTRDRETARLERDIRRLNRAAARDRSDDFLSVGRAGFSDLVAPPSVS